MENVQEQLSSAECTKILEDSLKRKDVKLLSYSINSLSDKIEGFLGQHYVVSIKYEDGKTSDIKIQRCFMKVLNGSMKIILEMSLSLKAYEKEEFLYKYLFKEFEKLDIDVSFAPRGYLCKPYLVVLEDLSLRGFGSVPKNSFLDIDHCKIALKTLAKFHSTSILYEDAKSKELGKPYSLLQNYPEMFCEMLFSKEENIATKWFKHSLEGIFGLIEIVPENHVTRIKFAEKLHRILEDKNDLVDYLSKFKGTILHGDLWSNNFLFKYAGDKDVPTEATLIDYQLLKFGPPSVDVIQMIFSNTRKAFREKHYTELVDYYYSCLSECVAPLDLNRILPKNEYLKVCNDIKLLTKIQCLCDRGTTFIPDEWIRERVVNEELLRKYLFEERGQAIVEYFGKGGLFREIMEEDVCELREMLFEDS